jgi:predicted dehydrogenase/threonine dehydrogenase-like Zn-dependent dehydrogenase
MKQIMQSLETGETYLDEFPVPHVKPAHILVQSVRSLISLGTERMLVEFSRSNLLQKAMSEPARVKEVVNKIRTEGLAATFGAVKRKLGAPIALGYCNAGIVIEVGAGESPFRVGDRVVCNGFHADIVSVPQNLVAHIPEGVDFDDAPFAIIGAVGLQGIRLSQATFGEFVVVIGLGLIGLLTIQLLKAAGCRVIGYDLDRAKAELGSQLGVECYSCSNTIFQELILRLTEGVGADKVIICASSKAVTLINDAALICRKKAAIVLVGSVPIEIDRSVFYKKELSFQVSCSYGPGRYENLYDNTALDVPPHFVRWTAKRNIEAVIASIKAGQLQVKPLITQRCTLEGSLDVYRTIGSSNSIATLIEYEAKEQVVAIQHKLTINKSYFGEADALGLAVFGAGNFAEAMLLPQLKKFGGIKYIVSSDGRNATHLAKKFNIRFSATDYHEILRDDSIKAVFITTRHNLHAAMAIDVLESGKHVFVEKPLAMNRGEIEKLVEVLDRSSSLSLMVGYNRRFSPHIKKIKEYLSGYKSPISLIANVNAGFVPPDAWVHDPVIGGGRIIGEGCHFIDLLAYLASSPIVEIYAQSVGNLPKSNSDCAAIIIKFESGSIGTVNYFPCGNKGYAKERIEVHCAGTSLVCDNFTHLYGYGCGNSISRVKLRTRMDKGHHEQFRRYIEFLKKGGSAPISHEDLLNTALATVCAVESITSGRPEKVIMPMFQKSNFHSC